MKTQTGIALSLGLLGVLLAGGPADAQMPAWEAASYQAPVLANGDAPRKGAALPYPRLSAGLNRLLESRDELAAAAASGFQVAGGRIQVHIETTEEAVPALVAWLEREGAERVSSAYHLVQAHVSPSTLRALATHPDVVGVRKPFYYRPSPEEKELRARIMSGSMVTEALAAMNVPAWHNAGIRGQGVKVGVIDGGFTNYTAYLGSDLPPANRVFVWSPGAGNMNNSEHGLMCAEIVTDIAPQMDGLYLAAVETEVDIVNATQWMQSQGVKVITMSLGWLSWGPGDGTGILANNINSFVNAGGFWSNSAGNSRLAHWQGTWRDTDGDGWLEFDSAGREVNFITSDGVNCQVIPTGVGISASLIWNQWNAPTTDLDFYIVKFDTTSNQWVVLGKSEGEQNGQSGQRPVEEDFDQQVTDAETCYGFAVKWYSGPTNVQMEFFNRFDSNPLAVNVQEGSITPPADTATAVAAAALNVNSFALKAYSSKGPTNGPGGALTGGFIKPDLSAFADVSCHAYGAGECGGTSAAAPHIGGAAALVRSGYPSYTGTQTRTYLETNAVDMGPSGKDNDYGTGRLRLGAPPASSCSYSISPSSRSHGSAAESGTVSVTTTAGCAWTAQSNTSWITVTGGASGSGSGTVSYSVAANGSSSQRTGTLTIAGRTFTVTQAGSGSPPPSGQATWVEAVINLNTSGGDRWRSDVAVYNAGSSAATINFRVYLDSGGTVEATSQSPIPAGGQAYFVDLVGQLQRTDKGSLEVWSSQPLVVTSRTYNDRGTAGTYGQFYDGYSPSQGLAAGQVAVIPQLRQDATFRSNISVTNTGTAAASVTLTLHLPNGTQVWSDTRTLAPGRFYQWVRPFQTAGQNNLISGFARIRINSGSGVIASGSVIDGRTGDPFTIPAKRIQ